MQTMQYPIEKEIHIPCALLYTSFHPTPSLLHTHPPSSLLLDNHPDIYAEHGKSFVWIELPDVIRTLVVHCKRLMLMFKLLIASNASLLSKDIFIATRQRNNNKTSQHIHALPYYQTLARPTPWNTLLRSHPSVLNPRFDSVTTYHFHLRQ